VNAKHDQNKMQQLNGRNFYHCKKTYWNAVLNMQQKQAGKQQKN